MARKETDSKRKKATRLEETAMAIQLAEDKEELVKRETGIVALERRVKKQEDQLRSKANKLKNNNNKTVMEAGQLDSLADQILDHRNTSM